MKKSDVADKLQRSRMRLMLSQPYLAAAIARLPFVDATDRGWCSTAATDGYYIYTDDEFFAGLSEDDAGFVIAHEVMHCVLGHIDRRGTRDRGVWNIAADYATNGLLVIAGMTPPPSALHNNAFAGLTAEDIYDHLQRDVARQAAGSGGRRARIALGSPSPTLDRHIEPGDSEGADIRVRDFPSLVERNRLRAGLSAELYASLAGREAGYFAAEIKAGQNPSVRWQELLSRFVSGLRRNDYRLFPPNAKHLWRGIYLPAVGVPGPEHLVVAIDTSGSMSDEVLREVLGEIDELRSVSQCTLTVIQCDAQLQSVERFEPYETAVLGGGTEGTHRLRGRGGTDLRPPFQWLIAQRERGEAPVDAVIYCTDGFGPLPEQEPDIPVVWIVPKHGVHDWPWGHAIPT